MVNRTKIDWADFTVNPITGLCPVHCKDNNGKEYCYARRMYRRFRWDTTLKFKPSVYNDMPKKPARIFVGSTMEIFLFDDWLEYILNRCQDFPQHTFIFLTKRPKNLLKWSPFPLNAWVGVSAPNREMMLEGCRELEKVEAKVRFLSIEPMLENVWVLPSTLVVSRIDWLILGSRTQPIRHPPREWVEELIEAADIAKVKVFIKEPLASHYNIQRQEFPK